MKLEDLIESYLDYKGDYTFYHGTTTSLDIGNRLMPPDDTGVMSEVGRKKNLNKVFMTQDINHARVYAMKAAKQFGGDPVVYRTIPMGDVDLFSDRPGATIYTADWAFIDREYHF